MKDEIGLHRQKTQSLKMPNHHTLWLEIAILIMLCVVAISVRLPGLINRSIWNDEAITLLETAAPFPPSWPKEPQPAHVLMEQFLEGKTTLGAIYDGLRSEDPNQQPLYLWTLFLWRQWFGFSLETARVFSLVCSLGAILVLYVFLRVAKVEYPIIPTMIYALSSGTIRYGQEARAYALVSLLVLGGILCAYLAFSTPPENRRRTFIYASMMAVCCGGALQTHYLALFPVTIILIWFVVQLWPRQVSVAIVFPLVTIAVGMLGLTKASQASDYQLFTHRGFVGVVSETKNIIGNTLGVIWWPRFTVNQSQMLALKNFIPLALMYGGLSVLIGIALFHLLWRRRQETNYRLWVLLLGIAVVTPTGIFLQDLLFNISLHETRYFLQTAPAIAILVGYGIVKLISWRQRLGIIVLIGLLGFQITTGTYWGFWPDDRRDNTLATMAMNIESSALPPYIVLPVSVGGRPRGHPAGIIYELNKLNPDAMILVLDDVIEYEDNGSIPSLHDYHEVVLTYGHRQIQPFADELADRLQEATNYVEEIDQYKDETGNKGIYHLRSVDSQ